MDQAEAIQIVRASVEENYSKVIDALHNRLGIPKTVLGGLYGEVGGYVNGQRAINFLFTGDFVEAKKGTFSFRAELAQAACYQPLHPSSLLISTSVLEQDAIASGVNERALLDILLFHEMTHIAMIGKFANMEGAAAKNWVESEDVRYMHEAAALKACEFVFYDIYRSADEADVNGYLTYVKEEAENLPQGRAYLPYFSTFRQIPIGDFWQALMESSPIALNLPQRQ